MKSFRALIPLVCLAAGSFLALHAPIGMANAMPPVAIDVNGQPQAFHAPEDIQVQAPRAAIMHAATQDVRGDSPHELQGLPKHENDNGRKDPPDPPKNPGFHPKCDKYTRGCAAEAQGVDSRAPLALRHDGAASFEQPPKMVLKRHTTAAEADASMPADHGEGQPPAFEAQDARDHKASDDKVFDTPAADAKAHELQATVESGTMASGHHADQASEETGPTASEHHKPREGFLASFLRRIYTVADNLQENGNSNCPVNNSYRSCEGNSNAGSRPISPEHCDWHTRDCKNKGAGGNGGGGSGTPPASASQALGLAKIPSQHVKPNKHEHGALGQGHAHGHGHADAADPGHHGHVKYVQVGHKHEGTLASGQEHHHGGVATDGHPGYGETPYAHGTGISIPKGEAAVPKQADTAKAKTGGGQVSYEAIVPRWREKCDERNRGCLDYADARSANELGTSTDEFAGHQAREQEDLRAAGELKGDVDEVKA